MDYDDNVTFARTALAENGEALLPLDDPTDQEIRTAIIDVSVGARIPQVVVDLHDNDDLHFMVPSFGERVWKRVIGRWRMARLHDDGAN